MTLFKPSTPVPHDNSRACAGECDVSHFSLSCRFSESRRFLITHTTQGEHYYARVNNADQSKVAYSENPFDNMEVSEAGRRLPIAHTQSFFDKRPFPMGTSHCSFCRRRFPPDRRRTSRWPSSIATVWPRLSIGYLLSIIYRIPIVEYRSLDSIDIISTALCDLSISLNWFELSHEKIAFFVVE